jgi:hypothetical protein
MTLIYEISTSTHSINLTLLYFSAVSRVSPPWTNRRQRRPHLPDELRELGTEQWRVPLSRRRGRLEHRNGLGDRTGSRGRHPSDHRTASNAHPYQSAANADPNSQGNEHTSRYPLSHHHRTNQEAKTLAGKRSQSKTARISRLGSSACLNSQQTTLRGYEGV